MKIKNVQFLVVLLLMLAFCFACEQPCMQEQEDEKKKARLLPLIVPVIQARWYQWLREQQVLQ
jgi:hypothetical protein